MFTLIPKADKWEDEAVEMEMKFEPNELYKNTRQFELAKEKERWLEIEGDAYKLELEDAKYKQEETI